MLYSHYRLINWRILDKDLNEEYFIKIEDAKKALTLSIKRRNKNL